MAVPSAVEKTTLVIAALLLIIHGLMELMSLPYLVRPKRSAGGAGKGGPQFIFGPLRDNIRVTMTLGLVFGFLRVIAAAGLLANLMWAWVLSVTVSVVTLTVMTLYLPVGVVDGVLSGLTLVSLLITYFGNRPVLS